MHVLLLPGIELVVSGHSVKGCSHKAASLLYGMITRIEKAIIALVACPEGRGASANVFLAWM
jgi:hypothetical protein